MDGQQDVLDRVLNVAAVTVPLRGKGTQIRRDLLQKSMIGGSVALLSAGHQSTSLLTGALTYVLLSSFPTSLSDGPRPLGSCVIGESSIEQLEARVKSRHHAPPRFQGRGI